MSLKQKPITKTVDLQARAKQKLKAKTRSQSKSSGSPSPPKPTTYKESSPATKQNAGQFKTSKSKLPAKPNSSMSHKQTKSKIDRSIKPFSAKAVDQQEQIQDSAEEQSQIQQITIKVQDVQILQKAYCSILREGEEFIGFEVGIVELCNSFSGQQKLVYEGIITRMYYRKQRIYFEDFVELAYQMDCLKEVKMIFG